MRYSVTWGLAFASVLALEGTCYARNTAPLVHEWLAQSTMTTDPGRGRRRLSARTPRAVFRPGSRRWGRCLHAHFPLPHIESSARQVPDQHACPLFIALAPPSSASPLPGTFQRRPDGHRRRSAPFSEREAQAKGRRRRRSGFASQPANTGSRRASVRTRRVLHRDPNCRRKLEVGGVQPHETRAPPGGLSRCRRTSSAERNRSASRRSPGPARAGMPRHPPSSTRGTRTAGVRRCYKRRRPGTRTGRAGVLWASTLPRESCRPEPRRAPARARIAARSSPRGAPPQSAALWAPRCPPACGSSERSRACKQERPRRPGCAPSTSPRGSRRRRRLRRQPAANGVWRGNLAASCRSDSRTCRSTAPPATPTGSRQVARRAAHRTRQPFDLGGSLRFSGHRRSSASRRARISSGARCASLYGERTKF